ncbi:MAG: dual specificity protein phosphatase family protein [Flavobacteriaceae bacterium]|nr:dual specificity protein phosphatase family protein [Flavobacteriaceae bacterium]
MNKTVKRILLGILVIAVIFTGKYVYDIHLNYNFKTITDGKVFSSGVIPPEKIKDYVEDHNIKTIVDFRHPGMVTDLNPAMMADIEAERAAVDKIEGVTHHSIPSDQVPTQANLDSLFNILDQEDAYPVLMHCYHGTGRAQIYSAIYRIEYEDFSNEEARKKTRILLKGSSFDDGKPKGEFLKAYKTREAQDSLN